MATPRSEPTRSPNWGPRDIIEHKPLVVVDPRVIHLAAHLEGWSRERREVFEQSVRPDGWPAVWRCWHEREGSGWEDFKRTCLQALDDHAIAGIPIVHSLILAEWDRSARGYVSFQPTPEGSGNGADR
jgi:hypothetical protein